MADHDERLARRRQERTDLAFSRLLPKPGPKMATGVIWWALASRLFMARAPYQPTAAEETAYSELMQQAIFSAGERKRRSKTS